MELPFTQLIADSQSIWQKPSVFGLPFGVVLFAVWVIKMIKENNQKETERIVVSNEPIGIWEAIEEGDYKGFTQNLAKINKVNIRNEEGLPLLGLATMSLSEHRKKMVEDLLANGADPSFGEDCLAKALIFRHDGDTIQMMVDRVKDINANPYLDIAWGTGNKKAITILEKAGCTSKAQESLQAACIKGDLELVKFHINKGADPTAQDSDGDTPLVEAVGSFHYDIAEYLIEKGADPKLKSRNITPYELVTICITYVEKLKIDWPNFADTKESVLSKGKKTLELLKNR